jgi:SlyX protein
MQERIVELESKVAFQDELINRLDEILVAQRDELDRLSERVRRLEEQVKAGGASMIRPEAEETPPPHY